MSTSDEDDDDPETYPTLTLIIGRRVLTSRWQRDFITREPGVVTYQNYQVATYRSPPNFNLGIAQQLLPTLTRYRKLAFIVSLLELSHQQIVNILAGLTILLETASADRFIYFLLDYEEGNVEHDGGRQLAEDYDHHPHCTSLIHPNSRGVEW